MQKHSSQNILSSEFKYEKAPYHYLSGNIRPSKNSKMKTEYSYFTQHPYSQKRNSYNEKSETNNNQQGVKNVNINEDVDGTQNYQSLKNKLSNLESKLAQIKESIQSRRKNNKNIENALNKTQNYTYIQTHKNKTTKIPVNKQNSFTSPTKALKMKISGSQTPSLKNILKVKNTEVRRSQLPPEKNYDKNYLLNRQSPKNKNSKVQISSYVTQVTPEHQDYSFDLPSANLIKLQKKKQLSKIISNYIYYITPLFQSISSYPFQANSPHRQHFISSFQFFKYSCSQASSISAYPPPCPKKIKLPSLQSTRKYSNITKTIIFDLDETLIHCLSVLNPYDSPAENEYKVNQVDLCLDIEQIGCVLVNIRPHLKQTLEELSKHFQLILFTASHSTYANSIIDYIDPYNRYFAHKYFRESCYRAQEGFYIKDLRIIDREIENILLVDNAAYSYCLQPDNGVPIIPFYDDKSDNQLLKLKDYLLQLLNEKGVRDKNREIMRNIEYSAYNTPLQFINSFFR